MTNAKGATLDVWQRQAVLAAAALLRERFGATPGDTKAKAVHDALLEVVEPKRRAVRLQREMSKAADGAAVTTKTDRRGRARDRRTGWDRRVADIGSPTGIERRSGERRLDEDRRARR
ncbi:MAG: hypothetical protein IT181_04025 [Acidobacteria bacterium]|nr:hypothetical protein [Acidobacteriota bacterium]